MHRVWTQLIVASALAGAIITAAMAIAAHADGMRGTPPPIPLPPPSVIQGQSCLMTALQLGYQTGRREVAYAGTEACLQNGSRGAILPYGFYGPYVPPGYFIPPGWVVPY